MSDRKKELETEYIRVKSDIKARITMIKAYTESIQKSRNIIDELGKKLTALQEEYRQLEEGEKDE